MKKAFTLIEFMVAVAIVLILVGMIVPAIEKARIEQAQEASN